MYLRDYQEHLLDQTWYAFKKNKRVLSVLPCGGGKTIMFAYMCQKHIEKKLGGHVWFLVHRRELIEQTIQTFYKNHISMDHVFIGMVQTVSKHLNEYEAPTLIVFDEAHHATAKTWTKIIEKYPNVPLVGLTATPCRRDGKALGNIFQDMEIGKSPEWLIEHGYLSHYDYYAPKIDFKESDWKMKGSDFDQETVARYLCDSKIYGNIFKYIDLKRKTIIYCPSVKYSQLLVEQINDKYGKVARHFDGDTPNKERDDIIKNFKKGNIRILSNVDLIGEGFDVPDCDCVMLLRPTMSLALYIQQSMRCLRPGNNKKAVIYDFVGNVFRHGLPTQDQEWSLDHSLRVKNPSGEKDLIVRTCSNCYRVYKGRDSICPYCGFNNGKTRAQIKEEQEAELKRIEKLEKRKLSNERKNCETLEELINLGKKRGYKDPVIWARHVFYSRKK